MYILYPKTTGETYVRHISPFSRGWNFKIHYLVNHLHATKIVSSLNMKLSNIEYSIYLNMGLVLKKRLNH